MNNKPLSSLYTIFGIVLIIVMLNSSLIIIKILALISYMAFNLFICKSKRRFIASILFLLIIIALSRVKGDSVLGIYNVIMILAAIYLPAILCIYFSVIRFTSGKSKQGVIFAVSGAALAALSSILLYNIISFIFSF